MPLDAIDALARKHHERFPQGVITVMDDSHGIGVLDVPGIVEQDLDLAVTLQTSDGIDGDACHDRPP